MSGESLAANFWCTAATTLALAATIFLWLITNWAEKLGISLAALSINLAWWQFPWWAIGTHNGLLSLKSRWYEAGVGMVSSGEFFLEAETANEVEWVWLWKMRLYGYCPIHPDLSGCQSNTAWMYTRSWRPAAICDWSTDIQVLVKTLYLLGIRSERRARIGGHLAPSNQSVSFTNAVFTSSQLFNTIASTLERRSSRNGSWRIYIRNRASRAQDNICQSFSGAAKKASDKFQRQVSSDHFQISSINSWTVTLFHLDLLAHLSHLYFSPSSFAETSIDTSFFDLTKSFGWNIVFEADNTAERERCAGVIELS